MARGTYIAAIALLPCLLCTSACRVQVLHDIEEDDANAVVEVLQREGIDSSKERVSNGGSQATYTVSVARGDAQRAWSALRQHNLPSPRHEGLGEVFGNVGLVPTGTQERALLRHALSGEIARTLHAIEGVRRARVHVVLPQPNPLAPRDEADPQPRAAVLLRTDHTSPISADEVRKLVAGSVEGLAPASVEVVMHRARTSQPTELAPAAVTTVGPFEVAAPSRGPLLATLIVTILLLLGLGLALLLLFRRIRSLELALAHARQDSSPRGGAPAREVIERSLRRLGQTATRYGERSRAS